MPEVTITRFVCDGPDDSDGEVFEIRLGRAPAIKVVLCAEHQRNASVLDVLAWGEQAAAVSGAKGKGLNRSRLRNLIKD